MSGRPRTKEIVFRYLGDLELRRSGRPTTIKEIVFRCLGDLELRLTFWTDRDFDLSVGNVSTTATIDTKRTSLTATMLFLL